MTNISLFFASAKISQVLTQVCGINFSKTYDLTETWVFAKMHFFNSAFSTESTDNSKHQ